MTPEVSKTYYAVRRVALHPPQDPNEFIERVLQAIRHHPEQLAELAGRWHRRVAKMKREERELAEWEEWLREKGGRTQVWIGLATSNHVGRLCKGFVNIRTHDPYTAALIVEDHGGTPCPEHACWLLDEKVDIDIWIPQIQDMLATMPQPTYRVVSGFVECEQDEVHGSGLSLSEALTTASRLFGWYQEERVKEELPRLQGQFTSLDNCDSVYEHNGRADEWYWLCDESETVIRGDDMTVSDTVGIVLDDSTKVIA
jgi:hypothetical protein